MTTLDKDSATRCCVEACKKCNPELQIKDLKGTIEGFQIAAGLMFCVMFLMTIGVIGMYDSREYWKADAKHYQERYHSSLSRDTVARCESVALSQNVIDLKKAAERIHSLELEVMKADANLGVCNAEKGRIVAEYEYLLAIQKTAK